MSGDEMMHTPDEWAPLVLAKGPHDHKGHSEEKCVRCGWVMGHQPLNCQNDDTPHVFPSQLAEVLCDAHRRPANGRGVVSGERLSDALVANLAVWASDAKPTAHEVEALAREVQESRAEVERLRAAGDALAVRYRKTFGLDGMFDAELRQWEAACRE